MSIDHARSALTLYPGDPPDMAIRLTPEDRGHLLAALTECDEYKKSLTHLLAEVHRLSHLVVFHGSDPYITLGSWATDPNCCAREPESKKG